ncbi:probable glycosyltransferase At5g03795 isoform X2 [Andrographis paniculata]|nr:probable glycosyltransferase At5g03795 isoform X2 [Andrographis paniculata]XP_051149373.1 probable glycosyltransferase At5g03795 isoform X2 [Andrographis paniculata]
MLHDTSFRKNSGKAMPIIQMASLLLENRATKKSKRASNRDRELQAMKFQIENAPIQRSISRIHSSIFRNYSMFKRSYELMETKLKVYVYREGEKPIFHTPYTRGIYASEGWFLKLIERNKQFVVKDPKKAHLFYLPFSSVKLRNAINDSGFASQRDLENHLRNYVNTIATKHRFWNKSGGADHFLVACHDWAPRLTRSVFESSIRVLCNSNVARGFRIGKDVSLPVTYIRSADNPLKDIGGYDPSNRSTLAFFAGGMHGYVRPALLQHWHNKTSDMKILGPMSRDAKGKEMYREFMKSSKYCICAKGYEVHTPRVVESIYYECVPVIVSDNYVPPFFEVFEWESFAVFVAEADVARLREILLSIGGGKYARMVGRLKMVRRYFLWHRVPERFDLFHMILHSVWYNRLLQI